MQVLFTLNAFRLATEFQESIKTREEKIIQSIINSKSSYCSNRKLLVTEGENTKLYCLKKK